MQVPVYSQPQARVGDLPGVRLDNAVTPLAAGAAGAEQLGRLGQGMAQATDTLMLAQARLERERDADMVQQAETALKTKYVEYRAKAMERRGSEAVGLVADTTKWWDDATGEVTKGLENDRQRKAVELRLANLRNASLDSFGEYESGQRRKSLVDSTTAAAQADIDTAAVDPANVMGRLDAMASLGKRADILAKANGWTAEQRADWFTTATTSLHKQSIQQLLASDDPQQAARYFEDNQDGIRGSDRAELKAAIDRVTKVDGSRKKAQTFADGVMAAGLSFEDAIKKARTELSGDEEDHAVNEIKVRFQEGEAGKAKAQRALVNDAWTLLTDGKAIPSVMWKDLPGEERRQIMDWREAKARRAKADAEAGGDSASKQETWYGLRQLAMDDPQKFANLDLRKSMPFLSKADFKDLANLQTSIAKGDAKAMDTQRVFKSTVQQISTEMQAAGIDLTLSDAQRKKDPKRAEQAVLFQNTLMRALDDAQRAKGAPLDAKEARTIGLSMVREGVEQGSGVFGFFQTKKRGFEIASDESLAGKTFVAKSYGDIPTSVAATLAKELPGVRFDGTGRPVLNDAQKQLVERAYTRGIEQGRF